MALIQQINPSELYHMACRMYRGDSFGYKGWKAIGEYLQELSDDIGQDVEVDIVSLCCDYSMAESAEDFAGQYEDFMDSIDPEEWEGMGEDEKIEAIRDYLQDETSVVVCEEDMIIWQAF